MSKRSTPIFSSRADDPELRDEIDRFGVQLAERVDAVQDALCAGDLELLSSLCSALGHDALRLGYSTLADAASRAAAAGADLERNTAEDGVVEITQLGQRIRLGHRGAA